MTSQLPNSTVRFTIDHAKRVAAALAEVLPGDRYAVAAQPGMGYDGLQILDLGAAPDSIRTPNWYIDNTYGGDDGYSDHLRVYFTTADDNCIDDHEPVGAPRADADPVTIAKWIMTVVHKGTPELPA